MSYRDPFGIYRSGPYRRSGPDRPDRAARPAPSGGPGPHRVSADGRKVNVPVNAPLPEDEQEEGRAASEAPVTERPWLGSLEAPFGPSVPLDEEEPEDELPYADTAQAPEPDDMTELAAKAGKADQYLALAQRTQADFENFRKRAARETAAAQERGAAKLAKELLPAVDNLDRAARGRPELGQRRRRRAHARLRDQARARRSDRGAGAGRDRAVRSGRRAVRPPAPRGGCPAACRGCRAGDDRRGLPARLPAGRHDPPAGSRGRSRLNR